MLLLRRLHLRLPLTPRACAFRRLLDPLGNHQAACRAVALVCRVVGARVARNMRIADMNLPVHVADARWIEIVCNGLPLWHGAQLAVDTTCVSPVTRSSEPRQGADSRPGASVSRSPRCQLVVFAVETGGRWGPEPTAFLRLLAQARAASAHAAVRSALRAACVSRGSGIIAVAAQRALVARAPSRQIRPCCRRAGRA